MFVSDKIIFLELQKTASTHIRRALAATVEGQLKRRHSQAPEGLFDGRHVFWGSIRDPWGWYSSLWRYGCDRRGTVYGQVTRRRVLKDPRPSWLSAPRRALEVKMALLSRRRKLWLRLYKDASDPSAFREWLHMMHDPSYRYDFEPPSDAGNPEVWGGSSISDHAGLLTFRYMRIFCCRSGERATDIHVSCYRDLAEHERKTCFIDYFVRNERLEADLINNLRLSGITVTKKDEARLYVSPRTNASSHQIDIRTYYDEATARLVGERERPDRREIRLHISGPRGGHGPTVSISFVTERDPSAPPTAGRRSRAKSAAGSRCRDAGQWPELFPAARTPTASTRRRGRGRRAPSAPLSNRRSCCRVVPSR